MVVRQWLLPDGTTITWTGADSDNAEQVQQILETLPLEDAVEVEPEPPPTDPVV